VLVAAAIVAAALLLAVLWNSSSASRSHGRSRANEPAPPHAITSEGSRSEPPTDAPWVQGVVFGVDNVPVGAGAIVEISNGLEDGGIVARTATDRLGRYRFHAGDRGGHPAACFRMDARSEDGASISRAVTVLEPDPLAVQWTALFLVASVEVRWHVVDTEGHIVRDAICWAGYWLDATGSPWLNNTADGHVFEVRADGDGMARCLVPPGNFCVWGRREGGLFGSSVNATVESGASRDLGLVVVSGGSVEFELTIEDHEGTPLPTAAIRLPVEHAVQRRVGHPRDSDNVHFFAGPDGVIRFATNTAQVPAWAVVVAPGFLPLYAELALERPAKHKVALRLAPTPLIRVQAETRSGARPPAGLPLRFNPPRSLTESGALVSASKVIRRVGVGMEDPPARELGEEESSEVRLAQAWTRRKPAAAPDGSHEVPVPQPGTYQLDIELPPGQHFRERVRVKDSGVGLLTLLIDDGRIVTVSVEDLPVSQRRGLSVWPSTADLPPVDWPANRGERIDATLMGSDLDGGEESVVWLPWRYSHLAFGWGIASEVWFARKAPARCPTCGGEGMECSHPLPGTPTELPPGARRFPAMESQVHAPLGRVAIPGVAHPTVRVPPFAAVDPSTIRVEVAVSLSGEPLRQSGLALWARPSAPRGISSVAKTDESGVACFALPPGEYEFSISPDCAPPASVRAVVDATHPQHIEIELRGR